MSSSSPLSRRNVVTALLGLAIASPLLAGCQVKPLYGSLDMASGGSQVAGDLAAISIDPISGYTRSTAARELYNELTFKFERGTTTPEKRYTLKVLINVVNAEVGVEQLADVPAAYSMTMNATFVLSSRADDTTLMTGKSFATASYDFSDQRLANTRARRDAEERVAKAVADDIHARIAGFFASQSAS